MTDNNQNIPNNKLKHPTDYKLEDLSLISSRLGSPLDLKRYMVELNYFEDLFNNTISGNIVMSDAVGVLNFGELSGTEFINIKLSKSDDLPHKLERTLRIYGISNRRFDPSNNKEVYTLEFCSEEYLLSEQYRLSKSYKGINISTLVWDICNSYLKIGTNDKNSKTLSLDETIGVNDFVLPNKKPIETINWLANFAVPKKYPNGADIIFFENKSGFFFTSLQHLYQTKPIFKYAYNPKNVTNDALVNMTNVLTFQVVKYVDTLDAIHKGTLGNRILAVDPLRRTKNIKDFDYNAYYQNSAKLNGSPVINNYRNKQNKALYDPPPKDLEAGAYRVMISNTNQQQGGSFTKNKPGSVQNDFQIEKVIPNRIAQLGLATNNILKITVPGNPALTIGTCIELRIASSSPLSSKQSRPIDPYLSGKYLISAVRHILTPASFITVLEICKDSVLMNYSGVNNNDPSWKSIK